MFQYRIIIKYQDSAAYSPGCFYSFDRSMFGLVFCSNNSYKIYLFFFLLLPRYMVLIGFSEQYKKHLAFDVFFFFSSFFKTNVDDKRKIIKARLTKKGFNLLLLVSFVSVSILLVVIYNYNYTLWWMGWLYIVHFVSVLAFVQRKMKIRIIICSTPSSSLWGNAM